MNDLINSTVLFPERDIRQGPEQFGLQYEDFFVDSVGGYKVHGWYTPADDGNGPVFLISHGNAGNVGEFLPWASLLVSLGFDAVLYDYQGYGRSQGNPDVSSLVPDGQAVLRWITDHLPDRTVGVMGLSLGTLVSIALAAQDSSIACAVLEGSLIPHVTLKESFGVLGAALAWAVTRQIPEPLLSDKQVTEVHCPVLFVHSANDQVTGLPAARQLFESANCPKEFWQVPASEHLDVVLTRQQEYRRRLQQFLSQHLQLDVG